MCLCVYNEIVGIIRFIKDEQQTRFQFDFFSRIVSYRIVSFFLGRKEPEEEEKIIL